MSYATRELSLKTYPDFERLAAKGGRGSCWCTAYQRARPLRKKLSKQARKQINRKYKRKLVREGRSHAALVYDGEIPVGWCQYGTQDELPRIDEWRNSSRLMYLPPSEGKRLWRITCFYVVRNYRRKGVAKAGLRAALSFIQNRGGGVVEAYPVVSKKMINLPETLWFGTPSMFEKEGFSRVAPLGKSLVLMRKTIAAKSSPSHS
jgi:ribosomal protein S18 acetylase RimI-like enzyme